MTMTSAAYEEAAASTAAPYWLTAPCPHWCVAEHRAYDHPEDRYHFSETADFTLTTAEPPPLLRLPCDNGKTEILGVGDPPELDVVMEQGQLAAEPRIVLIHNGTLSIHLTLSEAEKLGLAILEFARLAKTAP